jgi:hypothetical protein
MMRRAILSGAALTVLVIVLPAAASSAKTSPDGVGVGITHCNGAWTGTMTFAPPLQTGGTATNEEVSMQAIVQSCTGGTPTPTKGKWGAKGIITGAGANDCNNFFATVPPGGTDTVTFSSTHFAGAIYWTPTSISPSSTTATSFDVVTSATGSPVVFKAPILKVTGSYPTPTGNFKFKTTALLSTILTACTSSTGLGSVTIASPGSRGKF